MCLFRPAADRHTLLQIEHIISLTMLYIIGVRAACFL